MTGFIQPVPVRFIRTALIFTVVLLLAILSELTTSQEEERCNYFSNLCSLNLFNGMAIHPNYATLNTTQLIELNGYPAELHKVITEDGYILTMQRVPYSSKSPLTPQQPKTPVFLMHGIFASSAQWFWQPPSRALIFMLVDAGYDVWLGNARGTSYSRGTVEGGPSSYWDFSFHEIGTYDIPAFISHIKNVTGQESLYYIGHSLGTTDFAVFATTRPELNSSIRTYFALSPTVYIGNMTNLFFRLVSTIYSQYAAEQTATLLTAGPVLPELIQSHLVDVTTYCAISAIECTACTIGLAAIFGINPCQTNWTTFPGYLAHIPDAVSGKTLSHVSRQIQYGTFRQYDYGFFQNIFRYGSWNPPDYKWANYKVPSVFVVSRTEDIATPQDVLKSSHAIGDNLKETIHIPYTPFLHLELVYGIDADRFIYKRILEILDQQLYG